MAAAMEHSFGSLSRNVHRISRTRHLQLIPVSAHRHIHTSGRFQKASPPPGNYGRGPQDDNETRADLASFDVLRNTAAPATAIDACTPQGFALDNGARISGSGILLVGGEVFRWRPWLREQRKEGTVGEDEMTGRLLNKKGQWEVPDSAWGVLELIYPKPGMRFLLASSVFQIAAS